jgi:hypothetical protein
LDPMVPTNTGIAGKNVYIEATDEWDECNAVG